MEKTTICTYWENNTCKFMYNPEKCHFSHGMEDINKINCKYGVNCYNSNCKFYHGNETTISNMVYDIPIVDKRKNKNKKNLNYIDDVQKRFKNNKSLKFMNPLENQEIIPLKTNIPYINIKDGMKDTFNIIKIINKEKGINEVINILNTDFNKMLSAIDDFYINRYNIMVYKKNKHISQIVKNNYKNISCLRIINNDKDIIINKLNLENDSLKKGLDDLKNENGRLKSEIENTKYNTVVIKNKKIVTQDQNKLKLLYDKYIILYKLFNKYNNYKLINLDELKKYTKDKNIYKLKQRATKIHNFYEKFKNGTIKHLLPVSFVFKMIF